MRTASISLGEEWRPVKLKGEAAMNDAFARLVAWAGGRDVTAPGHPRCFHLLPGSGLPEFLEHHGMKMTFRGVTDQPDPSGIMRFEVWEATGKIPLSVVEGAAEGMKRAAQ